MFRTSHQAATHRCVMETIEPRQYFSVTVGADAATSSIVVEHRVAQAKIVAPAAVQGTWKGKLTLDQGGSQSVTLTIGPSTRLIDGGAELLHLSFLSSNITLTTTQFNQLRKGLQVHIRMSLTVAGSTPSGQKATVDIKLKASSGGKKINGSVSEATASRTLSGNFALSKTSNTGGGTWLP